MPEVLVGRMCTVGVYRSRFVGFLLDNYTMFYIGIGKFRIIRARSILAQGVFDKEAVRTNRRDRNGRENSPQRARRSQRGKQVGSIAYYGRVVEAES